jgi:uncharacterized membrane protein YfcA
MLSIRFRVAGLTPGLFFRATLADAVETPASRAMFPTLALLLAFFMMHRKLSQQKRARAIS